MNVDSVGDFNNQPCAQIEKRKRSAIDIRPCVNRLSFAFGRGHIRSPQFSTAPGPERAILVPQRSFTSPLMLLSIVYLGNVADAKVQDLSAAFR